MRCEIFACINGSYDSRRRRTRWWWDSLCLWYHSFEDENCKKLRDAAMEGRVDEVRALVDVVDIQCPGGYGETQGLVAWCSPDRPK